MKKAKEFILKFLDKESECWTNLELADLNVFNNSVKELYEMATDNMDESLGILQREKLDEEDSPISYKPRHLFKLSEYKNKIYGDIWVAYVSIINPRREINKSVFLEGFIIGEIGNELKIIGKMIINTNRSNMKVEGWKSSVYNPSDLDINKLGEFISTERYFEPGNRDDFSLEEYLKDK